MKSLEKIEQYSEEKALDEAVRMQDKIKGGEAKDYSDAEKEVETDKENEERIDEKLIERFGEIKISNELKQQISPYLDNKTLSIANEYLAAVVTERSERGAGIGFWSQVRVFLHDQNAMQEWNWRHKDSQHLDQKNLSVNNIGNIKASKNGDQIIIITELLNNDGKRDVDFEFTADKTKPPFEDGEIPVKIAKATEVYARKEIDEEIEYAGDIDKLQEIAKASGVELTEKDFRKVIANLLILGKVKYFKKAQDIAKSVGLELTKDEYKEFVYSCRFSTEWIDAKGKYWPYPEDETCKPSRGIDIVSSFANFSAEDYEEMVEKFIAEGRMSNTSPYSRADSLKDAEEMAKYGKLDKKTFQNIAKTYLGLYRDPGKPWPVFEKSGKVLEMLKAYNLDFSKDEYQKIVDGFLSRVDNPIWNLKQAQEAAEIGGIKISEDDYRKFLDNSIEEMFPYEKKPASFRNYPEDKLKQVQEIAEIAGINLNEKEESLPAWLKDVQKKYLEEADKMYLSKPEMRSATSRTGNKPYEKPEITESVVDETKGYGAFVFKEQIDHDTRFPQMRYTLYFVDKSGNQKLFLKSTTISMMAEVAQCTQKMIHL